MIQIPKSIELQDYANNLNYVTDEWNAPTRQNDLEYLSKKSLKTIVDIGANVGVFTDKYLSVFPEATFHLFEPDPINFEILQYNFNQENIILHNFGIYYGVTSGLAMGTHVFNSGGYIFSEVNKKHLWPHTEFNQYDTVFQMKKLEEILSGPVDLIKMDIEGSEYNVIENSSLLKESEFLLIEFHGHDGGWVDNYIRNNLPDYGIKSLTGEHYNTGHHWYTFLEKCK